MSKVRNRGHITTLATCGRLAGIMVLALALTRSGQAQRFGVVYGFTGTPDAGLSYAGLLYNKATGTLYGTTSAGGAYNSGAVFKVNSAGEETVLYSFTGTSGDGKTPFSPVIADNAGNLYGTTYQGGVSNLGTVFKLNNKGQETVLYSFSGPDGASPGADVIRDNLGNLYGTTQGGGSAGLGTVFKLTPSGTETVLHSFTGGGDGANPIDGLIRDAAGNLYGTTEVGGTSGVGVVFKLDVKGDESILYSFNGTPQDGANPVAGLIQDGGGNLYGTTYQGGASNFGTVFKLDPLGKETVLYSFAGSDGEYPFSPLIRDSAGNLYGTTAIGGSSSSGTVFKLSSSGKLTVLHNFTGGPDGAIPYAGLVRDASGSLYSTTEVGGTGGYGTVFKITP